MFHDMFVRQSGLRRAQGTKNEILSREGRADPELGPDMFHDMFVH